VCAKRIARVLRSLSFDTYPEETAFVNVYYTY